MHKVINFGSALQAYALFYKIKQLGYEAELIDYKYPNSIHKTGETRVRNAIKQVVHFINCAIVGFPNIQQKKRYEKLWKSGYTLSSKRYESRDEINANPPLYDIYVTGSDQVWNSLFVKSDDTFLLAFAPNDKKKISYSSSFAYNYIPKQYCTLYEKHLLEYSRLSVREESGIELIRELTGMNAELVCDPTLLLTVDEWRRFSVGAKKYVNNSYILVYMLAYSFDPFPDADYIVNYIQQQLGKKVIFLDAGKRDYFKPNSKVVKDAGPKEFVDLFLNADFVITTSFHGTAFSVNFNKPFLSIIKKGNPDSRIVSLLNITGLQDNAISYDEKNVEFNLTPNIEAQNKLDSFRNKSIEYLKQCLQ